jgi:hypothetical protein
MQIGSLVGEDGEQIVRELGVMYGEEMLDFDGEKLKIVGEI